jgi:hypothetical protein
MNSDPQMENQRERFTKEKDQKLKKRSINICLKIGISLLLFIKQKMQHSVDEDG